MSLVMDDIKYFNVVSETLNVTRASEIIGISQPALSYSIKRLESELGGQLLIRLKNGIQLTKLGEEFLKRSRRLIYEWEQAQNIARPETDLIEGSYTFAIHPSVALYSLDFFITKLQQEFPGLNFKFIHGLSREMTEKVISWEADFGIVVNPIQHPDLVIKNLYHDEVAIFYRADAPPRLIFDQNLTQAQHILKKIGKKKLFSGEITSENLELVAKLTALGLGYGILPTTIASQYERLKKMRNSPTFKDEISLVYRPEKHSNRISKKIIEIIRSSDFGSSARLRA